MLWSSQYAALHLIALALSCGLLAATYLAPRVARALFLALFAWACAVNWLTALHTPQVYLEYAELTFMPLYRAFILGWFASHVLLMVGAIATCQGAIALGLFVGGRPARLAGFGAIVFLLMIAPLGVGSGFPSSVLMAVGLGRLLALGAPLDRNLPSALIQAFRAQRVRRFQEEV